MFRNIKTTISLAAWTWIATQVVRALGRMGRDIVEYRKHRNGYYKK